MQNSGKLETALFFSAFPYKRRFLHFIKEYNKNVVISKEPWNEKQNIQLLKYFYNKNQINYAISKTQRYLKNQKNFHFNQIILWNEPEYSYLLKQIYDPPIVLFIKSTTGKILNLNEYDSISIVGTRNPFPVSLLATDRVVELFSIFKNSDELVIQIGKIQQTQFKLFRENLTKNHRKIATVSGFARGIDHRVHKSSLFFNVPTIAILGSGIDFVSPKKHLKLFLEAAINHQEFYLVSEFFPSYKAGKYTFPLRNRIIAGLSQYLFVMQAGEKSGALISTDYALQENRDIYCFDHPFFDNLIHNNGNKKLIEEGANVLKIEV